MLRSMIHSVLAEYGVQKQNIVEVGTWVIIIGSLVLSVILYNIFRQLLKRMALKISIANNKYAWLKVFVEKRVFDWLAHILPTYILFVLGEIFVKYEDNIFLLGKVYFTLIVAVITARVLDALAALYNKAHEGQANIRPINSYVDLLKIIVYSFSGLLIIAILFKQSLLTILSGIGALTAVFLLVFRDTLLGLVASVQISTYNLVQIGDWIELQKYGIDGKVEDINLNTMKIRNFDNSVSVLPTHMVISESFRNWRGMEESGGRRIKRHVLIDVDSIKTIHDFDWNLIVKNSASVLQEQDRRLTNVGILQAYLQRYLQAHPQVSNNLNIVVRQLQPNDFGLPIEIYCYSLEKDLLPYEAIQSEIMEEIFTILPILNLRMYQRPSTYGQRQLATNEYRNLLQEDFLNFKRP